MGLFGKLLGRRDGDTPKKSRAPKPPRWAREAFGDDGDKFATFVEVIGAVAAEADISVSDDDIRSGSLTLRNGHEFREWVLDSIARTCASSSEDGWYELVEKERVEIGFMRGRPAADPGAPRDADQGPDDDSDRLASGTDPRRVWVAGTTPWGGVFLEAGERSMVVVALPIVDRQPFASAQLPPDFAITVVACNHLDHGHLATTAIAKLAHVPHVFAVDPARPVDRGHRVDTPNDAVEVRAISELAIHKSGERPARSTAAGGAESIDELRVETNLEHGCVIGRWRNGQSVIVGDAIPLSLIGVVKPTYVFGKVIFETSKDGLAVMTALAEVGKLVLIDNVPGPDARTTAKLLAMIGVSSTVMFGPTTDPANAVSRKQQILAHMVAGDLDRADAIASQGIAAGDDVDEMAYQRAMIALMRGDDGAALGLLAGVETPHARSSRAAIATMRGDDDAPALAREALQGMPGDPIAIRGAVVAHVRAGMLDVARTILADNRPHLDVETAAGLDQLIARPDEIAVERRHVFPQHAEVAMQAIETIVGEGRHADAEPMLRRIRGWDPGNYAITAELGFVLAQLGKLDDAIAVYDESIARGGGANLLRFNRGNCLAKKQFLERSGSSDRAAVPDAAPSLIDAAIADYRWCIDVKPDWHEARLSLASSLNARGDRTAARAQLDELKQRNAPAHFIAALEDVLTP